MSPDVRMFRTYYNGLMKKSGIKKEHEPEIMDIVKDLVNFGVIERI